MRFQPAICSGEWIPGVRIALAARRDLRRFGDQQTAVAGALRMYSVFNSLGTFPLRGTHAREARENDPVLQLIRAKAQGREYAA